MRSPLRDGILRPLLAAALSLALAGSLPACDGEAGAVGGEDDAWSAGADVAPGAYNERRDLSAFFDVPGEDAQTSPPQGHIPAGATDIQIEALTRVNWYRWKVGLPPVNLVNAISEAAQKHCECYVAHPNEYARMSPHREDPAWPEPCTGETMLDRIEAAGGSTGAGTTEVIAFELTPTLAVEGWMDTLYHRLPILDPKARDCGYGEVIQGFQSINTLNFVRGDTVADREGVHLYPYDGQTAVPVSWHGYESPQPPPPPSGYPSGPIITMTLGRAGWVAETHELFDGSGALVPHTFLDHRNDSNLEGWDTVSLYAHEPLDSGETYQVHVRINDRGAPRSIRWSFTTR